jgi:hypothetical protein
VRQTRAFHKKPTCIIMLQGLGTFGASERATQISSQGVVFMFTSCMRLLCFMLSECIQYLVGAAWSRDVCIACCFVFQSRAIAWILSATLHSLTAACIWYFRVAETLLPRYICPSCFTVLPLNANWYLFVTIYMCRGPWLSLPELRTKPN